MDIVVVVFFLFSVVEKQKEKEKEKEKYRQQTDFIKTKAKFSIILFEDVDAFY